MNEIGHELTWKSAIGADKPAPIARVAAPVSGWSGDLDTERQLLGAILLDAGKVMPLLVDTKSDIFTDRHYRAAYKTALTLHTAGKPVDSLTVAKTIKAKPPDAGWIMHLTQCMDACPTACHAEYYLTELAAMAQRRQLSKLAQTIKDSVKDGHPSDSITANIRNVLDGSKPAGTPELKTLGMIKRVYSGNDPNELLRYRYLSRGGGVLLVAQSGAGKSSFIMQAAIMWALNRPFFGIHPARQLRTLIVQAENDEGDMAEMRDGVLAGLDLNEHDQEAVMDRISVANDNSHTSHGFGAVLRALLAAGTYDLLIVDPALTYLGGDAGQQKDVSLFLRNIINPILAEYRVGFVLVHHTNKPPKGDDKSSWQGGDWAYLGAGSAEWMNWARGIINIEQVGNIYRLRLAKRGKRVGLRDDNNEAVLTRWIAHARDPEQICWRDADADEIPEPQNRTIGRKPAERPDIRAYAIDAIALVKDEPMPLAEFRDRLGALEHMEVRLGERRGRVLFDILTDPADPLLFTSKKGHRTRQFIGQKEAIEKIDLPRLNF